MRGFAMSQNSVNRDVYFEKYIKHTPNADSYLLALKKSPYKTHRRMGSMLQDWVDKQIEEQ